MTREEALSNVRSFMGQLTEDCKESIRELVPELRESEDERIRKRIRLCLDECVHSDIIRDYERDECLSYLEKQKEQKPETMWTINDAKPGDILNSVRVQATIIYKGMADDGKHILAYCALQKGFFISQELTWDRDFEPASEYWKNALYDAMAVKGYKWDTDKLELKKIEQQPAEWSEEDEQWLESIIKDYEDSLTKDKAHAAVIKIKIDFLKSLRPQPHWKPSKEQMDALNNIILQGEITYINQTQELISLKDGLKKL